MGLIRFLPATQGSRANSVYLPSFRRNVDRALRRHHRQRVKNNRKKYWTVFPHEESPKRLGIITTTLALFLLDVWEPSQIL